MVQHKRCTISTHQSFFKRFTFNVTLHFLGTQHNIICPVRMSRTNWLFCLIGTDNPLPDNNVHFRSGIHYFNLIRLLECMELLSVFIICCSWWLILTVYAVRISFGSNLLSLTFPCKRRFVIKYVHIGDLNQYYTLPFTESPRMTSADNEAPNTCSLIRNYFVCWYANGIIWY